MRRFGYVSGFDSPAALLLKEKMSINKAAGSGAKNAAIRHLPFWPHPTIDEGRGKIGEKDTLRSDELFQT